MPNAMDLPSRLQDFLTNSDFRVDWSRRRLVIYLTLAAIMLLYGLIHVALLYAIILTSLKAMPTDLMVGNILGTLVYTDGFLITSIFASYVFGATFEVGNFRRNAKDLISRVGAPQAIDTPEEPPVQQAPQVTVETTTKTVAPSNAEVKVE